MTFSPSYNNHKYLFFRYIVTFIFIIYTLGVKAQLYPSDQNPPSLKWEQINTANFQIIYPTTFQSQAQKLANLLEGIISRVSSSLGKKPRKISIILQNQGTSANGFVQLAPRRSELFATPSQAFDYQNWLNGLAVHELRHVVQFDKLTGHFNKPPLESLALAMFGITLPSWFYEGDAVTTETVMTEGGRGRIPEWSIALRSNTLSGKKYSYSKNYFGSVKDFTPGYYQLGFFMNTKLRRDFGNGINDSLMSRISSNPFRPYNFSNSVKKFTKLSTKKLHNATLEELENLWSAQAKKAETRAYVSLNKRSNKTPESFLLPASTATGSILFLKQSMAKTPAIYEQDKNGKIRKILEIGAQETPLFSYAANKIVWDEFRYDPRFRQRSFNVINIYDKAYRTKRQLTHRSRLFAPALSPDGKTIAAIEVSVSHQISLVEISAETGKELKRYKAPENNMLQMPTYHQSGNKIAVIAVATSGKTIYELNRATGEFTQLLRLQLQEMLRPVYAKEQLLFKAHFNGIDNIYRLNPTSKEIYQLTSSKFGAHNPSFDPTSGKIFFNNYTPEGYDIASLDFKVSDGININSAPTAVVNYADPLIAAEGGTSIFENLPQKIYTSKPLKELNNLFYFHSILPVATDIQSVDDTKLGFLIQSDNKLNTLSLYTGYQYDNALNSSAYEAGLSYRRFFPVFNMSYSNRAELFARRVKELEIPVLYRENEYKADINIPLVANRFNAIYRLDLKAGTSYNTKYDIVNDYSGLIKTLDFPMHYEIAASRNSRRSARDLAPKWGQNISIRYRHFPFETQLEGEIFSFKSTFYFPGIITNHSFQASYNFQSKSGAYKNTIDIPRVSGYSFLQRQTNPRNTLLLDYRLPLFYPDWELGPLAYIKRFKAGIFADFENIDSRKQLAPRSFGAELRADMNILRFPLPNFDFGAKIIFLNESSKQNPIFETIAIYNF